MICPWCKNKCIERKEAGYVRYECISPNLSFIGHMRKDTIISFTCKMLYKVTYECSYYLEIIYNNNPSQSKLYVHNSGGKYKPSQRLKVIDGVMTPEEAAHLITKYSKLMAFI